MGYGGHDGGDVEGRVCPVNLTTAKQPPSDRCLCNVNVQLTKTRMVVRARMCWKVKVGVMVAPHVLDASSASFRVSPRI